MSDEAKKDQKTMETVITTYIPVTRRKNIHRIKYPDGVEATFHLRLDKALDEAWNRGSHIIVVETEDWRYYVEMTRREAINR